HRACAAVAGAAPGKRDSTLNSEAFGIGQLDTSKNLGEAGLICSTVRCSGGGTAWGVRRGSSTWARTR
ncbi:MAG TPA: hypothetical protein VD713_06460, partial [Sphingomonadales bacterium]|nr:hypothetical protein [Sphingomonadales bacterium]